MHLIGVMLFQGDKVSFFKQGVGLNAEYVVEVAKGPTIIDTFIFPESNDYAFTQAQAVYLDEVKKMASIHS